MIWLVLQGNSKKILQKRGEKIWYYKNSLYFCSPFCDRQRENANIAQLVEQLICNQPVVGSSPSIGSNNPR